MGILLKKNRYYYRKMIGGKDYWRALGLHKGQEALLSERLKQVELEVISEHYGLEYHKPTSVNLDLAIILEIIGNIPLHQLGRPHLHKLENTLSRILPVTTQTSKP
jgi:hypothetical protein